MEIRLCLLMLFLNLCECNIDVVFGHQCTHEPPKPQDVSQLSFLFYNVNNNNICKSITCTKLSMLELEVQLLYVDTSSSKQKQYVTKFRDED